METALAATAATSSPTGSTTTSSSSWFSGIVRGRSSKSVSAPPTVASGSIVSSLSESGGSGSRKKQLKGALFKYGSQPAQVAFKTGDFSQQVVFLGGLTDGLLATEYIEPLSIALENNNWSLVQPLLSSS